MNELPKACVILGAGASCDVHGEGSQIINVEYQPPLAVDLFDIAHHNAYYKVLHPYPGARALAQQLAPIVKSGQISIEKELLRYANHQSSQVRLQFKHIPAYLRDLIYLSSTEYTRVPSSYSQLIHELLAEHPHNVLFIVLNYDNLLEAAINLYNSEYNFTAIKQYVNEDRQAKVVKLHGSINWFKYISDAFNSDWINVVKIHDVFKPVGEGDLLINNKIRVVCSEPVKNYWVYPVLTAPLASKGISDAVCPESHINAAREFLHECQKFLIIGTSGLDDDLLSIIDSELTDPKNYYIHIVGLHDGAKQCGTRFREGVKVFRSWIPVECIFSRGFRDYLRHNLRSFAEFSL